MLRMLFAMLLVLASVPGAQAWQWQNHGHDQHAAQEIALVELPEQARETLRAIKRGGPFAYDRDGVVFGNFERALPRQPRGYYHEYTVKTPRSRNRGARRIISGGRDEYYYTDDHYQTFKRIRE